VQTLSEQHPELAEKLIALRENIKSAQNEISRQEGTIDKLTKLLDTSEQKATQRLIRIWQLTSALLSILLVVGVFIAWKLR
jgi:chromosome segregation ATPase